MRQYLYVSTSRIGDDDGALAAIVASSRVNNALDGVTGLLWSDGWRFAQVLEGGEDAVAAALSRIAGDPRHTDIQSLYDGVTDGRTFGGWAMIGPAGEAIAQPAEARMLTWLRDHPGPLATIFAGVIAGDRQRSAG